MFKCMGWGGKNSHEMNGHRLLFFKYHIIKTLIVFATLTFSHPYRCLFRASAVLPEGCACKDLFKVLRGFTSQ